MKQAAMLARAFPPRCATSAQLCAALHGHCRDPVSECFAGRTGNWAGSARRASKQPTGARRQPAHANSSQAQWTLL
eukprot:1185759-Alexandrium_andersonii.AAC.1